MLYHLFSLVGDVDFGVGYGPVEFIDGCQDQPFDLIHLHSPSFNKEKQSACVGGVPA